MIYAVPKSAPDLLYVGLNDRDKAWHDLYKVKISTGERTLMRKNTDRIAGWVFDSRTSCGWPSARPTTAITEILRVDPDGFTKIYTCSVFEYCAPVQFDKDDKQVYLVTNKGDDVDLVSLVLLDPQTGKTEWWNPTR